MEKNNLVKAKVNFEYMGLIILFAVMATIVAFLSGIAVAGTDSPDNDNPTFTSVIAIFYLVVSISISIGMTYIYVENKEYSSTKYNLKKKVITIEEDNTVKLDTIYTFTHK